jgi:hypothetical protein
MKIDNQQAAQSTLKYTSFRLWKILVEDSEIVQCAMEIGPLLRISCGGNEKTVTDLLTCLDKKHCQEVLDTPSKRGTKGRRELKNFECSIILEGSRHGKGKRAVSVF